MVIPPRSGRQRDVRLQDGAVELLDRVAYQLEQRVRQGDDAVTRSTLTDADVVCYCLRNELVRLRGGLPMQEGNSG